jgi:hypothetical protein
MATSSLVTRRDVGKTGLAALLWRLPRPPAVALP